MRIFNQSVVAIVAAGMAAGLSSGAMAAISTVSGQAITGWTSGNSSMASQNLPLPNLPVATTGLSFTSNALPVLTYPPVGPGFAASKSNANVNSGILSLAAGVQGTTNWQVNSPGYNYGVLASGKAKFFDNVTVQSSTLPAGTPVRVHLTVALAHAESVYHSAGLAGQLGTRSSHILSYVSGYIQSSWDGGSAIFSNDNKWFGASNDPSVTQLGLFAPGSQPVDIWLNTVVGRQLEISIELNTDNQGYFAPLTGFPTLDVSGMTSFTGALAFGASITDLNNAPINSTFAPGVAFGPTLYDTGPTPAVTLWSSYFNGAFPDASNATYANAQANLPPTVVPEPSAALGIVAAFAAPGLLARRRRA